MSFQDPSYVADILDNVLTILSAAFTAGGRPVDRVLRSPGIPAADCGQLAVWPQIRWVSPGTFTDIRPIRCAVRYSLDVFIRLDRCLPSADSNTIPTAAEVDADGAGYATDEWILARALTEGIQSSTFVPPECSVGRVNPITPTQPSGGLTAITTTMEVTLG